MMHQTSTFIGHCFGSLSRTFEPENLLAKSLLYCAGLSTRHESSFYGFQKQTKVVDRDSNITICCNEAKRSERNKGKPKDVSSFREARAGRQKAHKEFEGCHKANGLLILGERESTKKGRGANETRLVESLLLLFTITQPTRWKLKRQTIEMLTTAVYKLLQTVASNWAKKINFKAS
jgi:hypothetical protein